MENNSNLKPKALQTKQINGIRTIKSKNAFLKHELEDKFALLIINTEDPFIVLDAELSIITFNTQCAKQYLAFFGKEIIKGASILNYAQKEKKEALKLIYKKVLEGGSHESELEIASADKLSRTLLLRYKPAYDEKRRIIGVCISSTDISEIKKSQQLLTTN